MRPIRRRQMLGALGSAATIGLSGCLGVGGNEGDNGGEDDDGGIFGIDPPPAEEHKNGGSVPDDKQPATVGIGQVVTGEVCSFAVEYIKSIEQVRDYSEFPQRDAEGTYGTVKTIENLADQPVSRVNPGDTLYGIGVVFKNVTDHIIRTSTPYVLSEKDPLEYSLFMGRTQRLTYPFSGGTSHNIGSFLAPGEMARAEIVFAFHVEPTVHTFTLHTAGGPPITLEKLHVDLNKGTEADVSLAQDAQIHGLGDTSLVGDLEVTVHSAEYVKRVADSPYQEIYGPREGYEYLLLDLSATRKTAAMEYGRWGVGVRANDGYGFNWSTSYSDVMDWDRPTLSELSVGESISHTKLAFPIETGWRPESLTMFIPGPMKSNASQMKEKWFVDHWQIL